MHRGEDDQTGPFPAHLKQRSLQREFTSSEPKVNKYKWLGLAKRWKKKNKLDQLFPWERAYLKISHLLEAL